ncbi:hypothetical protein [Reyranella sp.]|uniref:hypothetical protein n=1 Tax=Reyranella sp. TaxID=1929291 RepID=UPI0027289D02|nr:hypothetical protein [Reyranella sp.]MDO8973055.1 hypothetical protein [Reyranella sp.]MDP3239984.1 hypothetical protein [Reyranella sp.]
MRFEEISGACYRSISLATRCHRSTDGQADNGIIADGRDAFQRDVAGALDSPFIVLFEQDGADPATSSKSRRPLSQLSAAFCCLEHCAARQ